MSCLLECTSASGISQQFAGVQAAGRTSALVYTITNHNSQQDIGGQFLFCYRCKTVNSDTPGDDEPSCWIVLVQQNHWDYESVLKNHARSICQHGVTITSVSHNRWRHNRENDECDDIYFVYLHIKCGAVIVYKGQSTNSACACVVLT